MFDGDDEDNDLLDGSEEDEEDDGPILELGQLVCLKSGSPTMTVASVEADNEGETLYIGEWYDYDRKRFRSWKFYAECVDVVNKAETVG